MNYCEQVFLYVMEKQENSANVSSNTDNQYF